MSRTRTIWLLIAIVALAVALRSYYITLRSVWFDESFTWRLIQFPVADLIARTAADVHPPLYYILVKSWAVVFGSSALALRSFSVLCAALSIVGAYVFTSEAFRSKRAGIIAAAFLAVSPWVIAYAGEARMYTLGMTFALFSSFALIRGIRAQSFRWFAVYGVLAAAFFYVHYYALFTIAAQALAVLIILLWQTKGRVGEIIQDRSLWAALCGGMLALILVAPWVPRFLAQRSQVQEAYWIPRLTILSVPDTLYRVFVPTSTLPDRSGLMAIVLVLPLVLTILIWLLLGFWRKSDTRDGSYLTLVLALVPFMLGIGISLGSRSLYNDRFFAFAGIFIFIALAALVDRISYSRFRTGAVAIVLIFSIWAHARSWNELDIAHSPGVHGAMQYIAHHRGIDDKILVSSPYIYFPAAHYMKEEFQADQAVRLYSADGKLSHFSGAPIAVASDVASAQDISEYREAVWVVDTTGFTEQPFAAPANWHELSKEVFPEVFVHQGDIVVRQMRVL
ncbi:MAG: hypothetical protein A3C02_00240 [Candidatus Andersenbacteria bacterium RIFCSPHIGHO2_02_FULL_45_11]|uniref:Glycosyltransferase RgtA/B/C/D-like domain-containing protein n=1 Tax=Candidatus Andersenbacteria bacterium RIFCSPHIGHO2_12_FULL_45_11 TaxID=1797281 RepID=A0A1G1X4E9_9BACT|nr:MAG: hypothetical protein A2805_02150 [Candidatus Andersenbacteria bacterium RIFCSPHIGHO2_01_FULL_46_36]OGY34528.1 MAG: hypothetical protein A3C02_00240 [Candidatus Andersenbacteria bacterium RIFCSPHIGHO2_02_FULL_45_11]OGY34896.1 MAG: hypothetical protein A3D99_04690 [Candidatus Andersenbacteria bacterium RIFCSPHIGHO2_12_FULL_45_11]